MGGLEVMMVRIRMGKRGMKILKCGSEARSVGPHISYNFHCVHSFSSSFPNSQLIAAFHSSFIFPLHMAANKL